MLRAGIRSVAIGRSLYQPQFYLRTNATQVAQKREEIQLPLHPMEALKTDTASGWAPPLGTLGDLPFAFSRTESKLLPVYHRYKKHNTQFLTVVRKYRGDSNAIFYSLRSLLGPDAKMKKYQGRIEIQGDHRETVQTWLRRLGF